MALTRKYLKELGIEADKIDLIIDAHTDTVDQIKTERDDLKDKASKADALKAEIEGLKSQAHTDSEWKEKYEAEKKAFDTFKSETSAKETLASKEKAYRTLLKETGISDKVIDKIIKLSALDEIELDGDGIKDADKLKDTIKEEWKDFITETETQGADTQTPPANDGDVGAIHSVPLIF